MKKYSLIILLCAMTLFFCACSEKNPQANSEKKDDHKTEQTETDTEQDSQAVSQSVQTGYLKLNIVLGTEIEEEINFFEVRYYVGEQLVSKKSFQNVTKGEVIEAGIDMSLLNGADIFTVEYIINGNISTKCIRNYQATEDEYNNYMIFDEENMCYASTLAG